MKKFLLSLCLLFFGSFVCAATLDEMIGQMVFVGFHGTQTSDSQYKIINKQIEQGQIGGIILFEHNIKSPEQLKKITNDLHKTQPNLFIGVDQEGGQVARLTKKNGFKNYKSAYKVSHTKNLQQAYKMYDDLAKMCVKYGFNTNFVPDVDLLLNPNSIIAKKERSFSDNPQVVCDYAKECINAHYHNKMVTSLKHFPGHGSPVGDTHLGYVDASNTWSEQELIPYKNLINLNDMQMVMVSHIFINKLDNKYPASLSKNIVTNLLRKQIGFKGVVITDDLHMGAIRNNYSLDDVVINAINAGNDILMFSNFRNPDMQTPIKVNKIIKQAIYDGKISEKQIEESYNRIMKLKQNFKK